MQSTTQQIQLSPNRSRHSPFDKDQILSVLASQLAETRGGFASTYLEDYVLLNKVLLDDGKFDWCRAAASLGINRWRLYHWFYETFQRLLSGTVAKPDVIIIKAEITAALQQGSPMDKQFQDELKAKLSREYHRSAFSISFNNIKREAIKRMGGVPVVVRDQESHRGHHSYNACMNDISREQEHKIYETKVAAVMNAMVVALRKSIAQK